MQQSIFVLVTTTMSYVEGVTFSDEPTKNYHQLCSSTQLYKVLFVSVHIVFWVLEPLLVKVVTGSCF